MNADPCGSRSTVLVLPGLLDVLGRRGAHVESVLPGLLYVLGRRGAHVESYLGSSMSSGGGVPT